MVESGREIRAPARIQNMLRSDIKTVHGIAKESFGDLWPEEHFRDCLYRRGCVSLVAKRESGVMGFLVAERRPEQTYIESMAVRSSQRRLGVGSLLVRDLFHSLSPGRRRVITVDVRETNLGAQLFFKSLGFKKLRTIRGCAIEIEEDTYNMEYRIIEATSVE